MAGRQAGRQVGRYLGSYGIIEGGKCDKDNSSRRYGAHQTDKTHKGPQPRSLAAIAIATAAAAATETAGGGRALPSPPSSFPEYRVSVVQQAGGRAENNHHASPAS